MAKKLKELIVDDTTISLTQINDQDYISITDMMKAKDGDFFISDWLRNANTLDYISAWESMNNTNFNYGEFAIIRQSAGSNSFKISVKELINRTNAIGITAKAGRYGGTYAHKDIAFNFGMWISPVFQLYIVKEYQRLKEIETNEYNLEWSVKRILSKANYSIQTEAVKSHIIPKSRYFQDNQWLAYAQEADILNVALFGCTAKEWRLANPEHAKAKKNIRDFASINELAVLSNIESINSVLIKSGTSKKERLIHLRNIAKDQLKTLNNVDVMKSLKKQSDSTYVEHKDKKLSKFNESLKTGLNFNPKSQNQSDQKD